MSAPAFYEDIEVGATDRFGRYEVTAEDIVAFARDFDPQPFHVDPAAAARSPFGGLIASGWHTAAMMMRMVCDRQQGAPVALASPGFEELRWLKPVRPGDVLSVERACVDKRPSRSRPDRGLVSFRTTVFNQHGEPVLAVVNKALYRRRTAD